MRISSQEFSELFSKWLSNNLTASELEVFVGALRSRYGREVIGDSLEFDLKAGTYSGFSDDIQRREAFRRLIENLTPATTAVPSRAGQSRLLIGRVLKYAAVIIAVVGSVALFYNRRTGSSKREVVNVVHENVQLAASDDIMPGSEKAVLTLSNGEKVELNPAGQQALADGEVAIRNQNGTLAYQASGAVVFNTMTTPRGGQYRLVLSDGTKVWLNAASTITYPTSFQEDTRSVSISGEVYFEVAKAEKPFVVKAGNRPAIEVLGTHFNVNAYDDGNLFKTSLLEGSIRISGNILKPGEAFSNGRVVLTNLDQDVAWKNGAFNFHKLDLPEVMLQLSRWYDLEVVYEGEIPKVQFFGEMGRDLTLSQVLKGLEWSGVRFKIEAGKKIIVKS